MRWGIYVAVPQNKKLYDKLWCSDDNYAVLLVLYNIYSK